MFFTFPVHVVDDIRQLVLLLNTVVLIIMLVVAELVYSERPKEDRLFLRYFYPICVVLVGLLMYAGYLQGAKG